MNKILFIVGPTATGKSKLAVEIARRLDGEIISCDSMQIYKNMDIGTAKVTIEEMSGIAHYMIDIVDAGSNFDVASYQKMADDIIKDILNRGKTPIIVGGTGLYVNSIIYPMSFALSDKDDKLRQELLAFLEENGKDALYQKLVDLDKSTAEKLHPNDTKRVIRAIEIAKSNKTIKSNLDEMKKPKYDYVMIGLNTDRKVLYDRINQRVDIMFGNGLLDEVNYLLSNKLVTFDSQSMQAIGYKEFKPYLLGEIDIDTVKDKIKQNSRNYAKRQITWFKKYENLVWFDINETDKAIEYAVENMM